MSNKKKKWVQPIKHLLVLKQNNFHLPDLVCGLCQSNYPATYEALDKNGIMALAWCPPCNNEIFACCGTKTYIEMSERVFRQINSQDGEFLVPLAESH